jgi:hypothetical protein
LLQRVAVTARPTHQTHLQRLISCLSHEKIPDHEKRIVRDTILPACTAWTASIENCDESLERSVAALNAYKLVLDSSIGTTEYISRNDGQLKLSGGLLEDFFTSVLRRRVASHGIPGWVVARQMPCASGIFFSAGGDPVIRTKVHDVAIARVASATFEIPSATRGATQTTMHLASGATQTTTMHLASGATQTTTMHLASGATQTTTMHLASVAMEIKTSLDKTMFQEACATAADLRRLLPDAKYVVVCEWLDMLPIPTASTAISKVYILRGRRKRGAGKDASFFASNPIRAWVVEKIVEDAMASLALAPTDDAIHRGFF